MSRFETSDEDQRHQKTLQDATRLMTICHDTFGYPVDALMASVLVTATLAHGIGMPLDHLLDGIRAAYSDVTTGGSDYGNH